MAVQQKQGELKALHTKSIIWTPVGRVSFAKFFPPAKSMQPNDQGEYDDIWECTLVCEPDAPELAQIKKLESIIITEKFQGKKPHGYKPPYKDGNSFDLDNPNYKIYADKIIIPVRSKNQEVIPHRVVGEREDGKAILEACTKDNFFSGVYAKAKISMYSYNMQASKGISCGLQNIYLVKSGEPLAGGRRSAEADFDDADLSEFQVDNSDLLNSDAESEVEPY